MTGGTAGVIADPATSSNNSYEGIVVEDCVIIGGHDVGDLGFDLDFNAATAPSGAGLRVRRCVFSGAGILMQWDGNESAVVDLDVLIESCLFVGPAAS